MFMAAAIGLISPARAPPFRAISPALIRSRSASRFARARDSAAIRSDGALANDIVTIDSLSDELKEALGLDDDGDPAVSLIRGEIADAVTGSTYIIVEPSGSGEDEIVTISLAPAALSRSNHTGTPAGLSASSRHRPAA